MKRVCGGLYGTEFFVIYARFKINDVENDDTELIYKNSELISTQLLSWIPVKQS